MHAAIALAAVATGEQQCQWANYILATLSKECIAQTNITINDSSYH
jgi:hypothetical protein